MIDTYLQIQCSTIPVVYDVIVDRDCTWKPKGEIELAVCDGTGCPSAMVLLMRERWVLLKIPRCDIEGVNDEDLL